MSLFLLWHVHSFEYHRTGEREAVSPKRAASTFLQE